MEKDKLVEIPPSDWIELRDIFQLNWPDNHVAWHTSALHLPISISLQFC